MEQMFSRVLSRYDSLIAEATTMLERPMSIAEYQYILNLLLELKEERLALAEVLY